VPTDNPFVGVMGARPEIWALGLRNPFTMAVQPGTGTLHINDVGGGLFEEVNVGVAGANYGWPTTEGDFDPAAFPQFTRPIVAYAHGTGPLQGNSIAGGAFYNPTSALLGQQFVGDYFFGEFVRNRIFVRDSVTGAVSTFADGTAGKGVVDVDVLPDGRLLYLSLISGSITQIAPVPVSGRTSAVAAGSGGTVLALNENGSARFAVQPFGAFAGGVRVATGDLNGDSIEDVIAVRGPGAPPVVVLYDGATGAEAGRFSAFDGRYSGGLNVTAGDITGDGKADVIVSSVTGIAAVQVIDVFGARVVALFNAFPGYANGASVAAGDVDLDGRADIIAGTLVGVSGVRVFSGLTLAPIREFFAFGPVPVGVNVGFVNGEIVTGTATGQAFVRVFNSAGAERLTFAAAPPQFNTGITIAALGNQLLAGIGGFAAAYDMATGGFIAAGVPFGGAGVFVG
jgi:Glucose / Sorbosone dehydrogenase